MKTAPKQIIIKLFKILDKEKILTARGKEIQYIQRNKIKDDSIFLIGNNASEMIVEQHL